MNRATYPVLVHLAVISILEAMAAQRPSSASPIEIFCDPYIWSCLSDEMKAAVSGIIDDWILVGLLNAIPVEVTTRGYITDRDQM